MGIFGRVDRGVVVSDFQIGLFDGELYQPGKKKPKKAKPEQLELIPETTETAGVNPRPQFSLSPHTRLVLISQDKPEGEEGIPDDQMPLFADEESQWSNKPTESDF